VARHPSLVVPKDGNEDELDRRRWLREALEHRAALANP
jgi:hypothetical protein